MKRQASLKINLIFIVFCVLANSQQLNQTRSLSVNSTIGVVLQPEQIYRYSLALNSSIPDKLDLYFIVEFPSNDPLQQPFLDIETSEGYIITCHSSDDQFSGVCTIPSNQLKPNLTVDLQLLCHVECHLKITTLLNNKLKLNLNDTITLKAPSDRGVPKQIQMQIPSDLEYTQIAIYAQIKNFKDVNQGIQMYANVGNYSTVFPTSQINDFTGQSIYWGGRGLFLEKQDAVPGSWIKIYLYLSEGMQIMFTCNVMNGNIFTIELGKAYFDFTNKDVPKQYILDVKNKLSEIGNSTLGIGFIVYGGNPTFSIAFDPNFTNLLTGKSNLGVATFLLTQNLRINKNFTGIVYIRVSSTWASDYYLYSEIDQKNFMAVFPDVSYYTELEGLEIYNYFFDDIVYQSDVNDTMRIYSAKIDMLGGKGIFGVRRCKEYETGSTLLTCVLNSTESFKNTTVLLSFEQIDTTIKKTDEYFILFFQYDLSLCTPLGNASSPFAHYCSFQLVGGNLNNQTIDYTISINKRNYAALLREGQLTKDIVFKEQYLYFKLGLSSLEEVVGITVFVTVIEGNIYLLGSTGDQYPTFQTNSSQLKYTSGNTLFFAKDQLSNNIYISIYGFELSSFTIGVIVTRVNTPSPITNTTNTTTTNNTNTTTDQTKQTTKISLQLDLSQQFTIQQTNALVTFIVGTSESMSVTVQIMQLAGTVVMDVYDASNTKIVCKDPVTSNTKLTCTFLTVGLAKYQVRVKASSGSTQKFIILYNKEDKCIIYNLNIPLFVELAKNQTGCSIFTISKLTQLQITTSLPLLQLLSQSLSFQVCIADHCLQPTENHHHHITKSDLNNYCKLSTNTSQKSSCSIKLSYSSYSNSSLRFNVIVEQQKLDVSLFDGIAQKISKFDLSKTNGKYFYYQIYDWSTIKVFFTSFMSSSFYLSLHFVQQKDFFKNTTNIYLPYRDISNDIQRDFSNNFYQTIISGSQTNIFTISSQAIDKYCDNCLLTISVYPIDTTAHGLSYFQIQVTQQQTLLSPGDSRIGYLENDEIYNYQLGGYNGDSVIYLRDLNKESDSQKDCFTARMNDYTDSRSQQINGGYTYIKQISNIVNIYVEAITDICNYEITYMLVDVPLITIDLNRMYQIQLRNAAVSYLLYSHKFDQSFKIIQLVQSGSSLVYVTPISNSSIQTLLKANPSTFPYFNADKDGQFVIDKNSTHYCSHCNYLIAIKGDQAVNSQFVVSDLKTSIPLSINGLLKEKINKTVDAVRKYSFNSITSFNISLSLNYGKIKITVKNPQGQVVYSNTTASSTTIGIAHNKKTQDFSFDFNSIYTRFQIQIQGLVDSSYSILASKYSITSRIFEGIPAYVDMKSGKPVVLQFLNLIVPSTDLTTHSLDLLIDVIDIFSQQEYDLKLFASIAFEQIEGKAPKTIPFSITPSDDTFNLNIFQQVGTYYLNLTMNKDVLVTVILAKQSLIHLAPSANAIMLKEGVFQLYSYEQSAMIQIFTCWGQTSVDASDKYLDFAKKQKGVNQIVLQQSNYGGHFVISAEDIEGEYFIRVNNRHKQTSPDFAYLINYYYYDQNDILPYKLIDIDSRQITYSLAPTQIAFSIQEAQILWNQSDAIDKVQISYRLYISNNKNKINKFANCRIDYVHTITATPKNVKDGIVTFHIDQNALAAIVQQSSVYFVGAEAVIDIVPSKTVDEDYPQTLRIIYEVIQLSTLRAPVVEGSSAYSAKLIIIWFLLPFGIAGLLLYCSLKYCIQKYRGQLPDQFVEEQGQSQQKFAVPGASPYADTNNNPNNASQELKDEF